MFFLSRYPSRNVPPIIHPQSSLTPVESKELIEDIKGVRHDVASLQDSLDWVTNYAQYLPRQLPYPYISTDEFAILPYFFPEYFVDVSTSSGYENNIKPKVHITLKKEQNVPQNYVPYAPYSPYLPRIGQAVNNGQKQHENIAVEGSKQELVYQLPEEEVKNKFIPLKPQEESKKEYGIPGKVLEVNFNDSAVELPGHKVYGVPNEEVKNKTIIGNKEEKQTPSLDIRYGTPISAVVKEITFGSKDLVPLSQHGTPKEAVNETSYNLPKIAELSVGFNSSSDSPDDQYGLATQNEDGEARKREQTVIGEHVQAPSDTYGLPSSEVPKPHSEYGPPPPSEDCLDQKYYGFTTPEQESKKIHQAYGVPLDTRSTRKATNTVAAASRHPGAYLEPPSHQTVIFKFVRRRDGTGLPVQEETTFNLLPYFNIRLPYFEDSIRTPPDVFQNSPEWHNHKTFKKDHIEPDFEGYEHIGEVPLDKHNVFDKDRMRLFDSYGVPLH